MVQTPKNSSHLLTLDVSPLEALRSGTIDGLVLTCHENERPPGGLLGVIDWYFNGAFTYFLGKNAFSGKLGECTYLPTVKNGKLFHFILVGAGKSQKFGQRSPLSQNEILKLKKTILLLRNPKLGVSRSDFGSLPPSQFEKEFQEVPLCVTQ